MQAPTWSSIRLLENHLLLVDLKKSLGCQSFPKAYVQGDQLSEPILENQQNYQLLLP